MRCNTCACAAVTAAVRTIDVNGTYFSLVVTGLSYPAAMEACQVRAAEQHRAARQQQVQHRRQPKHHRTDTQAVLAG